MRSPFGLFGLPPPRLVEVLPEACQFSPLIPGSSALEHVAPGTLEGMTMLAAPGTLERGYDIATMLAALAPDAPFTVLAPKDMGGTRLRGELTAFGCRVEEYAKAHHRICRGAAPVARDGRVVEKAIADGAPRRLEGIGLWTQPGIFAWDRIDPGTSLLLESLPSLTGHGADFGCGIGILAHAVLANPSVVRLDLFDIDRRALDAARRNVDDPRATFAWRDLRHGEALGPFDFVVMNPPFHYTGREDQSLGQIFIQRAAASLRKGARLWLVANRHLPYESVTRRLFRTATTRQDANGFKVIEATK